MGKSVLVGARMSPDVAARLRELAWRRRETVSAILRRNVEAELRRAEKREGEKGKGER